MGECKWSRNRVGVPVLEALHDKTHRLVADLKQRPGVIHYALFSRAGFTRAVLDRAKEEQILLFEPRDLA